MNNTYCPISWGTRRYTYVPFTPVETPQAVTNHLEENTATAPVKLTGAEHAPINAPAENAVGYRYQEDAE